MNAPLPRSVTFPPGPPKQVTFPPEPLKQGEPPKQGFLDCQVSFRERKASFRIARGKFAVDLLFQQCVSHYGIEEQQSRLKLVRPDFHGPESVVQRGDSGFSGGELVLLLLEEVRGVVLCSRGSSGAEGRGIIESWERLLAAEIFGAGVVFEPMEGEFGGAREGQRSSMAALGKLLEGRKVSERSPDPTIVVLGRTIDGGPTVELLLRKKSAQDFEFHLLPKKEKLRLLPQCFQALYDWVVKRGGTLVLSLDELHDAVICVLMYVFDYIPGGALTVTDPTDLAGVAAPVSLGREPHLFLKSVNLKRGFVGMDGPSDEEGDEEETDGSYSVGRKMKFINHG